MRFLTAYIIATIITVTAAYANLKVPEGKLTIERAYQTALEKNPGIAEAAARIQAAQTSVTAARSAFFPLVTAAGSYARRDGTFQPDWQLSATKKQAFTEAKAGIEAKWLIFDGFARKARILAAAYEVNRNDDLLWEVKRILLNGVSAAFHKAQLSAENMMIAKHNAQFNRKIEADMKKRWAAGDVSESDLLNFSIRAAQAETEFVTSEMNFNIACTVLAELLAYPDAKLPADMLPCRMRVPALKKPLNYETEIKYAVKFRPELRALEAGKNALLQKKKVEIGTYFPSIFLTGGVNYLKQEEIFYEPGQEEHDSSIGVAFSWKIFDGMARYAAINKINHQIREIENKKKKALLAIQSEIRQDIKQIQAALLILKKREDTVRMTQKVRSHVQKLYQAGATTLTRFNEAQNDLLKASGALAAARIQYMILLNKIDSDTGRILRGS